MPNELETAYALFAANVYANNELDGGAGVDTLAGGIGDDSYIVDDGSDLVVEALSEGDDTVFSTASYALGANVENLVLMGGAAINGTGNSLANTLTGNDGDNVLNGAGGKDRLYGMAGNDTYQVTRFSDEVIEDSEGATDVIKFVDVSSASEITFVQAGGDLLINNVRVAKWFLDPGWRIERVLIADGSEISVPEMFGASMMEFAARSGDGGEANESVSSNPIGEDSFSSYSGSDVLVEVSGPADFGIAANGSGLRDTSAIAIPGLLEYVRQRWTSGGSLAAVFDNAIGQNQRLSLRVDVGIAATFRQKGNSLVDRSLSQLIGAMASFDTRTSAEEIESMHVNHGFLHHQFLTLSSRQTMR